MNKKAASGWYRWLWISPIFTIPTLVVSTDFLYYDIAKGTLLSAAWHLILLIPSTNKQDPFIRWHGRQALLFAAARTITVLIFHEDLFFTVLLLIFIWFFGTLWGQKQAQEGKCFLMSTFAKDLDLDSLPFVQNTGSDKDSKDPKALVEIFRFSKDPLERQAALAQLEKLGLVEGLDRDLEDTFKKPISLEKPGSSSLKKEKRTTRSGWIIGAIIAVFIISLIIFSNYIKQVEQAQHIRTDTQIARTQNARTQIARTQISQRNTFSAKWPLTLSDTFVDNRNGWKIGSLSNDCYTGTRSIIDNSYVWEFSANSLENKFLDCSTEMKLIYSLQEISVEDFLLEVMVKSESNRIAPLQRSDLFSNIIPKPSSCFG